jgi:hypothetical protein
MKLWDRIQRGMDAGFDSALSAVHAITEKAGEGMVDIDRRLSKELKDQGQQETSHSPEASVE